MCAAQPDPHRTKQLSLNASPQKNVPETATVEGDVITSPTLTPAVRPNRQRLTSPQLRHLAESARLEERPDHMSSRMAIWVIAGTLLTFLVWASFAKLPEVARADGQISPTSFEREIQLPEGGTLMTLNVHSGQQVDAGQEIGRMDDRQLQARLRLAERTRLGLLIREEWLSAFVENREPDYSSYNEISKKEVEEGRSAFQSMTMSLADRERVMEEQIYQNVRDFNILAQQISAQESRVAAVREILNRQEALYDKGLVVFSSIIGARQDVTEAETELGSLSDRIRRNRLAYRELHARKDSLLSSDLAAAQETLQQTRVDLSETEIRILNNKEEIEVRRIVAPVNGTVKLPERLAVGDFIPPGQPIAFIVPAGDALIARVRVPADEISRVKIGQSAEIKVSALDFTRFGRVEGKVESISPGALVSDQGEVFYAADISLSSNVLDDGDGPHRLLPGMRVQAEIVNGYRTILEYIFKPVKLALEDAFKEE